MDEIEEVVEGIFRFAGITVIMLDSYYSLMTDFLNTKCLLVTIKDPASTFFLDIILPA